MSLTAAANTITLELERLVLLRETMSTSQPLTLETTAKLSALDITIYSHEAALQLVLRTAITDDTLQTQANNILSTEHH